MKGNFFKVLSLWFGIMLMALASLGQGGGAANNWVFGSNVTLNFSASPPGVPTIISQGNTVGGGGTMECATTISDATGKLMFFTNGANVYNSSNVSVFSNLATTIDAAQGNLAIPVPGTTDKYYLTTVDAVSSSCAGTGTFGSDRGSRYRVITIIGGTVTAASIGSEVTIKSSGVSEAQMAVPSSDGNYWLITHDRGNTNFNVSKVTNGGIAAPTSTAVTGSPTFTSCDYVAYLKSNSCYNRFALVVGGTVSLYSFNVTTGAIACLANWSVPNAYAAEFSPNGNYLFVSQDGAATNNVYQFTVTAANTSGTIAANSTAISGSQRTAGTFLTGGAGRGGQIQLGPDGVIYSSQLRAYGGTAPQSYIGGITNPNSATATFNNSYIAVPTASGTGYLGLGLPNFLKSLVAVVIPATLGTGDITTTPGCVGQSSKFEATLPSTVPTQPAGYPKWVIQGTTYTTNPAYHTFAAAGNYTVSLIYQDACGVDQTINYPITIQSVQNATATVSGSCPRVLTGAGSTSGNYKWYDKDPASGGVVQGIGATYNFAGTTGGSMWVEPTGTSYAAIGVGGGTELAAANMITGFSVTAATTLNTVVATASNNGNPCTGNIVWELRSGTTATGGTLIKSGSTAVSACGDVTISIGSALSIGNYVMVWKSGASVLDGNSNSGTFQSNAVAAITGTTKYSGPYNGPFKSFAFVGSVACLTGSSVTIPACCTPATIGTQPSATSICTNKTGTISVGASVGSGTLSYQWYENTTNSTTGGTALSNGGVYSGVTTNTLTFTNPTVASQNNKYYYVIVQVNGTCPTTSNVVKLTVNAQPTVSVTPASPKVCVGLTTTLAGSPAGGTWTSGTPANATINTSGVATGVASGTSVITYSYTDATTTCSNTATQTLTVNTLPTVSVTPASPKVCVGLTTTLAGSPAGGTWTSGTPANATINPSGVATGVASGTSVITYSYTDATTTCSNTATQTLTVNAKPTVSVTPASPKVCVGLTTTLAGSPAGGTWTSGTPANATINPSGVATGVASGTSVITYSYTDATTTCSNTATQTLTVNTLPTVSVTPASPKVCVGLTTTLAGSPAGGTWTSGTPANATINTSGVATGVASGTSVITYSYTDATTTCSNTATQTLTVNAKPTVSVTPASPKVCVGLTTTLAGSPAGGTWTSGTPANATINTSGVATGVASGTSVITYSYTDATTTCSNTATQTLTVNAKPTVSVTPASPKVCVGLTTTLAGSPAGGTWTSGTPANATINTSGVATGVASGTSVITYSYTDATTTCSNTATQTLTVNVNPSVNSVTPTAICSGQTTNITLSSTPTGATFSYTASATGGVTGGSSGTVSPIAQTLTAGSGSGSVTYAVTATLNGCSNATPVNITQSVNPVPNVVATPANPGTICSGTATNIGLSSSTSGANFSWTVSAASPAGSVTGGTAGTGTTIAQTLNNASAGAGSIIYSVTANVGACSTATAITVQQTVSPGLSLTSLPATKKLCAGEALSLSVTAGGATNFTYQWLRDGNIVGNASSLTVNPTTTSDAGTYNVKVSTTDFTGTCASITSGNTVVTVNAIPVLSNVSLSQQICSGAAMVSVTPSVTAGSYKWTSVANGVTGATASGTDVAINEGSNLITSSSSASGTVVYTVKSENGSNDAGTACAGNTLTHTITVNPGTAITVQPTANTSLCLGGTVTLTADASGVPAMSYKWQKGGVDVNPANVTKTLTLTNVQGSDAGDYTFVATSTGANPSCATATSNIAVVQVNGVVLSSTEPADQSTCAGGNVTFSVPTVQGANASSNLTYEWYKDGSSTVVGTSPSYGVSSVTTGQSGELYYVKIKDNGNCEATSRKGLLTVSNTTTLNSFDATPSSLCDGESLSLVGSAGGTAPFSYVLTLNGNPVNSKPNESSSSYSFDIASAHAGTDNGTYELTVTSACPGTGQKTATVTINKVTLATLAAPASACEGGSSIITVDATGSLNPSYQWYKEDGSLVSNSSTISGSQTSTLSFTNLSLSDGTKYYVEVKSNGLCAKKTSAVSLTVGTKTKITLDPVNQNKCVGNSFTVSGNAVGQSIVYQWYKQASTGGAYSALASGSTVNYTVGSATISDAGNYFLEASGSCGKDSSTVAAVVISASPTGNGAIEMVPDTCLGDVVHVTVNNTQASILYKFYVNGVLLPSEAKDLSTGFPIKKLVPASYLLEGDNYVKVEESTTGCGTRTLSTFPEFVVLGAIGSIVDSAVCPNASSVLHLSGPAAGSMLTYHWTVGGTDVSGSAMTPLLSGPAPFGVTSKEAVAWATTDRFPNMLCAKARVKKQIEVYKPYQPVSVALHSAVCEGTELTYKVNTNNNDASWMRYGWSVPSGAEIVRSNSDSTEIIVAFLTGGAKTLQLKPVYTCPTALPQTPYSVPQDVTAQPVADVGAQTYYHLDKSIALTLGGPNTTTGPGYSLQWTTDDPKSSISNDTAQYTTILPESVESNYFLTVKGGTCPDAVASVKVRIDFVIRIPNAFSPNGDQVHDVLEIPDLYRFPSAVFTIFNQWGEKVYTSGSGGYKPWDGKNEGGSELGVGTYYYILEYHQPGYENKAGYITLLK